MKIRPVGAEMFHADRYTDGQIDMTKLIIAFLNFANAPKNYVVCFRVGIRNFILQPYYKTNTIISVPCNVNI
jgi:hypothetical protein